MEMQRQVRAPSNGRNSACRRPQWAASGIETLENRCLLSGDGVLDWSESIPHARAWPGIDVGYKGVNAASSHGQRLTAVTGQGEGIVNVSPDRSEPGFSAEIQVAVRNTSPNTTFNVKRAVDFTPDGVCTSDAFVQFPLPNSGPPVQLTTSEGGAGATHIKFERPQIADGTSFDVRFELSTPDGSTVLRTECFTVSVK
jgi:hypothetical protein